MTRIFDTFMFGRELDMLECRLVELESVPNLVHVIVEAHVDHQDHPKPLYFAEHRERFVPWADRIVHVVAESLPTREQDPDPWAREHAQREWAGKGLHEAGAQPDDIVLHGDCDEIPTVLVTRNIRPTGFVALEQRLHCFAVDWLHPEAWRGTVAGRVDKVRSFGAMRDMRNIAPHIPNAGWHLSWLGTTDENLAKLGAFCHPEIAGRTHEGLTADRFRVDGWHVDGKKMAAVDVDHTYPRWIIDGRCPESWFRPRSHASPGTWTPPTGFA